jgi:hypothetical protein
MRAAAIALLAAVAASPARAAPGFPTFQLAPPGLGATGGARTATTALEAMDELDRRDRTRQLQQTYVMPERPGQNQVAWYEFDWHRYDVQAPGGASQGIRLYYYERERKVVEHALPVVKNAFTRLIDQFHYTPTKPIPYILYSSSREFQTTNVFQVSESVLGVTSPKDLKMSLPYFGEHEKFREVSTHELVHQFTIQKLLDVAGAESLSSPVESLPLWFVEGIAEYYAKGGIDFETDTFLRDLVWNPDVEHRYDIVSFPEDRLRGYIPTYKLGQARVAFIADVYGKEKIQAFIENAYLLGSSSFASGAAERNFSALVRRVLNEPLDQVDARWRAWLKKRYYPAYLKIRQDLPSVREIQELPAEVEAYAASEDGNVVLYRGIDREQGRARLYLFDPRYPKGAVEVASDNVPGVESLHPIEKRVMAVADGILVYAAQDGGGDSLYVQRFKHEPPGANGPPKLTLGKREHIEVTAPGRRILEVSDPALSRDGSHLAFVGLTEEGQEDIFVVPIAGGRARQVTDDAYSERDLYWGQDGIYCVSDSTDHGRYNVFRVDAGTGERTRLTTAPFNMHSPRAQSDGSVLYVSDEGGKADIHLLKDGKTRRLTDFATGIGSPSPSPGARGVYATTFYRGRFRMVEVPKVALLDEAATEVAPAEGPVLDVPKEDIPAETSTYSAYSFRNWHPEAGIVYGGGATNAVAGRAAMLFADILRDHQLYLDLSVYGSFDLTQGLILYEDRSRRTDLAFGAYHFVQLQFDRTFQNSTLYFLQRDFGASAAVRFPLDRFRRLEAEIGLGGVQRYCLSDAAIPRDYCGGGASPVVTDQWNSKNGGVNPVFLPTLRFGYDTVRYDPFTGPIAGGSAVLEVGGGYLPLRSAVYGFARADVAKYWTLLGRSNLMLRFAGGSSFAPDHEQLIWSKVWWISSADNLRGFSPYDFNQLVGQNYYVANLELQFPLDPLVRLLIFDYLEGVAALDFGGVFNGWDSQYAYLCDQTGSQCANVPVAYGAWDSRTLTGVLGVNVLFGPLLLRVHFGHPFDIGGQLTPAMAAGQNWVTNITLRYFFF